MSFPIEKYCFYKYENKNGGTDIVAVSTYAGKTVRGVAKCDPRDEFDMEKGKELAAARCNDRVSRKRAARAKAELNKAMAELDAASRRVSKMRDYLEDAIDEAAAAHEELKNIETEMRE